MPKYNVTAWRPAVYTATIMEVEAPSAEAAIEQSRDEMDQADYELCDGGKPDQPIDEIRAELAEGGEDSHNWLSDERKLEMGADPAAYAALLAFAQQIARFVKDRERDDNGDIFDMPNDDAVETLHDMIDQARSLTNTPARKTEDDPGTDYETETATIIAA